MGIIGLLSILAFAAVIANIVGRLPLWVAVLLLSLIHLFAVLPLRM